MKSLLVRSALLLFLLVPQIAGAQTNQAFESERDSLLVKLNKATSVLQELRLANDLSILHLSKVQEGLEQYSLMATRLMSQEYTGIDLGGTQSEFNYEKCRAYLYKSYEEYANRNLQKGYDFSLILDSIADVELKHASGEQADKYRYWKNLAKQDRAYAEFILRDVEEAIHIIEAALADAKKLDNPELIAKALKKKAEMVAFLGSHTLAVDYYESAIVEMKKANLLPLLVNSQMELGNQYAELSETKSAIASYQQAIEGFAKLSNQAGVAAGYYNLSLIYMQAGDYEYAFQQAKKAQDIYSNMNSWSDVANCFDVMLATAYQKQDYAAMINYSIGSLKIRSSADNQFEALQINDLLIYAYLATARSLNEYSETDYYLHQAFVFSQKAAINALSKASVRKSFSMLEAYMQADALNIDVRRFINVGDSASLFQVDLRKTHEQGRANLAQKLNSFEGKEQMRKLEEQEQRISQARSRFWMMFLVGCFALAGAVGVFVSSRKQRATNALLKKQNAYIEEQRSELNKQVEESKSLMTFKERMTNMIIHDLKTPLNGIMSAEFIDDDNLKNEIVRHSASEMMNLVQNVLDFYKSQETAMSVKKRTVNLASIVEGEVRNIRFILDEKMLEVCFDGNDVPKFSADPQLLRRVVSNVFSNAAKYSPQGGKIFVSAHVENQADLRILISNQGPPIPEHQVDLIFQPFGQAGDSKDLGRTSSTGLGLTFCRMAVEAHGGEIGVTPNKEVGAEFWILLPNCVV